MLSQDLPASSEPLVPAPSKQQLARRGRVLRLGRAGVPAVSAILMQFASIDITELANPQEITADG